MDLLKRVEKDLEEFAQVEQFPKMEGRQMVMVLSPNKKPKPKPSKEEESDKAE
jgi:translation initiation factor IF-3